LRLRAQDTYKIGMSAGLTGYAATVDRAWRDGVEIAITTLNARGGIMRRKIELRRGQPLGAAGGSHCLPEDDYLRQVNVFDGGCVSAGNLRPRRLWLERKFRWCCARYSAAA
jgi:branched-chain amino acid transport system substrate-binding protein